MTSKMEPMDASMAGTASSRHGSGNYRICRRWFVSALADLQQA
jgi:hypothetical protein